MVSEAADRQGGASGTVVVLGGDAVWPVAALLRSVGMSVLDAEPPPKQIDPGLAERYGFLAASVRAGALGDTRLILQQVRYALEGQVPEHLVWTDAEGLPRDAMRAGVEPGADSAEEVLANHRAHLAALKAALGQADLVVLPLRSVSLVEDGNGTLFPAPPTGMKPPKGCKTKAAPAKAEAMKTALRDLLATVRALRPECRLRLICLGDGGEVSALRAMAASWADGLEGVLYHPLVDDFMPRLRAGADDVRLGVLMQKLLGASDVITALTEAVAAVVPAPAEGGEGGKDRTQEKAEKRARKEARAKRRARAGAEARVVCEDELLEAFS